jgi:TPR repeat protein
MSAARYLNSLRDTAPVRTPTLEKIEHLALHDRDPRAMTLHAKILGLRKRYADAIQLIEQVMTLIYPSKVPVAKDGGFAMARIEPPWRVYAWLKKKAKAQANATTKTGAAAVDAAEAETRTDDLLRSAALDYQDPESLVQYAAARMQAGDRTMYEDCMSRAATAGNAEACRRLANFYYLTSLGRYPRRGVREAEAEATAPVEAATKPTPSASSRTSEPSHRGKFSALLSSVFGPQPRAEYHKLATEWYELAFSHGNEQAALVLAVLLREDGSAARGLQLLEQIEGSPSLGPLVRRIKSQWDEQDQEVVIPAELLDV